MTDYNTMNDQQCADWLAERDGWTAFARHPDGSITAWINERYASCGVVLTHPMPLTLDAAAAALREPWDWDAIGFWTATVDAYAKNRGKGYSVYAEAPDELTARYRAAVAARMEDER